MEEQDSVDEGRRNALKVGAGVTLLGVLVAAGIVKPGRARAADWNKAAFEAKTLPDALAALGAGAPADSADIAVTAPEIAENGAVVPITAVSKLPGTQSISFLVENNPNALAATFLLPEGTDPVVSTRVKLAKTSRVAVLVKAGDKFYVTHRDIKVTLGGCGG